MPLAGGSRVHHESPLASHYGLSRSSGAVVVQVEDDSPAYWAGVRSGDIVVSLDGAAIAGAADMGREMARRRVGETVRLSVVRDGQEVSLSVVLKETPRH